MSPIVLALTFAILLVLDTALIFGGMIYFAKKVAGAAANDLKAALELAHSVASDAMMHLKAGSALQVVEAKVAEKQGQISVEESRFIFERQQKELERMEAEREKIQPIEIKDEDGKVHNLRDFEPIA